MFLCSSTKTKILPRILIPKDDKNQDSWITIEKYRLYVIPILVDLFSYHVTCIRETLLEYFNFYWQLIDRTTLINTILPQVNFIQISYFIYSFCSKLVYGLKDSNDTICMLTLVSLSVMVPVLGADVVVGGQRKQIFSDKIKKDVNIYFKFKYFSIFFNIRMFHFQNQVVDYQQQVLLYLHLHFHKDQEKQVL